MIGNLLKKNRINFRYNTVRFFLMLIFLYTPNLIFPQNLVINEIMSSNSKSLYDEDGDASDWIELYNSSSNQFSITGYYLSDDSLNINKWQFGTAIIQPGEHLIVFASDKDTNLNHWHTNFKISASGETIILSDSNGLVVDRVDAPVLSPDVSYGRISDGSLSWIIQVPSPGLPNTGMVIKPYADSISVSLPSGFYPAAISLELSAGDSEIFYTLDGSDPDSNSSKYTNSINITQTSILKAISKKINHLTSSPSHHSYFINVQTDLPVISLISDPYNLFDYNYGIYELGPNAAENPPYHGANFWMEWERPAHVQFFDDNKNLEFSENCGIEIYGGYTRSFAQKSFAVKFKDPYNSSSLEYPLFPDFSLTTFKSFILRNSGNDFQFTHIRDAMMQSLIKDLDIDYLEYRPAASYINGEYWGIYNIREKISEHYVAYRHGVDPDNIDMLEGNMEVLHGDSLHYQALVDYISTNDMSTQESFDYVNSRIDLDNCLLYFAAQAYYNSQDWPANNLKYWRERSENGKWRWILFDLDFGFNLYETTGQSEDHIYYIFSGIETRPGSNPPWSTLLPRKLVQNSAIKNKFVNLVADLLNTKFKSERVINIINQMANHISNEGVKHRARWGISQSTFNNHIQRMISFAQDRPAYLRGFVRNFFSSGVDAVLNITTTEGGSVKLNSLYLEEADSPWSGIYFQNIPVTLKAIAADGYKFDGWSGAVTSNEDSITLTVTRTTNLSASFSIDSSATKGIVINEINYNSASDFDSGDWIELFNSSNDSINIGGWYFSDSDIAHKLYLPPQTIIEPGSYLVLIENATAFTSRFPNVKNYIGETGFGLNGSGEFMKLVNEQGQIVDSLTYDDQLPWPAEADGLGATLELVDASSDNSQAENWKASIGHGTPGEQNSVMTSTKDIESLLLPSEFLLYQNYPNPFNPTTVISYQLPVASNISLKVYNLLGQEVATIFEGMQQPGNYNATFDASKLTSGVYIYQLIANDFISSMKMLLIK